MGMEKEDKEAYVTEVTLEKNTQIRSLTSNKIEHFNLLTLLVYSLTQAAS